MIAIENLSLQRGTFRLQRIQMQVPSGAYAVLMGPTGCGKSSLLECIAGLVPAQSGKILLDGRDITQAPAADRGIGYVPQDSALFAGLTVAENLAFALQVRKVAAATVRAAVQQMAERLQIEPLLSRRTHGLSGGEKQRVAIGRALIFSPAILLLDEPLSALDESTRATQCELLQNIHRELGTTFLHVTHSAAEADALATVKFFAEQIYERVS